MQAGSNCFLCKVDIIGIEVEGGPKGGRYRGGFPYMNNFKMLLTIFTNLTEIC